MLTEVVSTELEVRWGECDPAGIVYHPAYIDWFAVARMHFLRDNGVPYMKEFHDNGVVLVVLAVDCKYMKTLEAEDAIRVDARLMEFGRTRAKFAYEVYNRDGGLCAAGHTEHAFVDADKRPLNLAKQAPLLWDKLRIFRGEHPF